MPQFIYTVKDANGKTSSNIMEALNEDVLVERLQRDGYYVIKIQAAADVRSKAPTRAEIKGTFTHTKVKTDDTIVFARQLATMLESGVTLVRSLDVILSQIESRELARVISIVKTDVENGRPLSQSLAKHPKVFDTFWVSLVEVGEASGTMPKVLDKLTFYIEQQAAFRSAVVSAMVYPALLFLICMGAISFFALFVGPRFEQIFKDMKADVPTITQILLNTFAFIKGNFIFIIFGIVGLFFLIRSLIQTPNGRLLFEKIMFRLPIFGNIIKLIVVERFASQMSILVDSGVPILFALEITEKLVGNRTCGLIVAEIREAVREGKLLAEPMQESNFFPPMAVQMIKVGEETGELGKMLKHVSEFYQRNVESFMKRFGTLLEPLMLVFMGAVIGLIVIAMFMPLFSLSSGGG